MMKFFTKKNYRDYEIHPDEIFIDKLNLSGMNQQQFEGVIEKRIPRGVLRWFLFLVVSIGMLFAIQLLRLQIVQGEELAQRAESNRLDTIPIFAERGLIYDRNNVELAWNESDNNADHSFIRSYISEPGYGHVLGYVTYPQKDSNGFFWQAYMSGQDGLEKHYNETLRGKNGSLLFEVDARGEVVSEQKLNETQAGDNMVTTIDSRLQTPLYAAIAKQAQEADFQGGAAVIVDVHSGALRVLTSFPEYDPYILAQGDDREAINNFFNDPAKPFLNRAISGLYSPGSTIKPFLGIAALNEGLITDSTEIFSTGRIEVPNPYNPRQTAIFRDWRPEGHGVTDIYHAIADSVNTFFYAISGGYRDQEGLGINNIEQYLLDFDIAQTTGITFGNELEGTIPTPQWKEQTYEDGTWRLGDTYNTSIGQFGFQVGVLQMARSIAALANEGSLHTPYLIEGNKKEAKAVESTISSEHYQTIKRAMRQTVTDGTARLFNIPEVEIAAKTGTAQVGRDNEYKNSWAVGFFPYEDPEYAFAVVMERAPNTEENEGSAGRAFRDFLLSLRENNPEFWE